MKYIGSMFLHFALVSVGAVLSRFYLVDKIGKVLPKISDQIDNENTYNVNKICIIFKNRYSNICETHKNDTCKIVMVENYGSGVCQYLETRFHSSCKDIFNKCIVLIEASETLEVAETEKCVISRSKINSSRGIHDSVPVLKGDSSIDMNVSLLQINNAKGEYTEPVSEEMKFIWEKCIVFLSEICRSHGAFYHAINFFYSNNMAGSVVQFGGQISLNTKNSLNNIEGFGLHVPLVPHIHTLINKLVRDKIQVYQTAMLNQIENHLFKRECVLVNEIDALFVDLSNYSQPLYTRIQQIIMSIIGGFHNLAFITYRKLTELVEFLNNPSMDFDKKSISSYFTLFNMFKEDLMTPLIRIMDAVVYNKIIELSTDYVEATIKLNEAYDSNEETRYKNAFSQFKIVENELSRCLGSELPITSQYGINSTNTFFRNAETKYKGI